MRRRQPALLHHRRGPRRHPAGLYAPSSPRCSPEDAKRTFRCLADFMQKAGWDYVILERASIPGAYFTTYPRHRQLISINKRNTGHGPPPASPQSAREWRREPLRLFRRRLFLSAVSFTREGGARNGRA